MSNPAVIKLADISSKKGRLKRFVIEDNIGESIHLHIDNMRIDFTIQEFLDFSQMIRKSLYDSNFICDYSIENFDEFFLMECSDYLSDLQSIEIEKIKLSNLKCIVHSNYKSDLNLMKLTSISETPGYKYLNGDKKDFLNYGQFNYFAMDNEKRLLEIVNSIRENGYPYLDRYIILFNGEDIVRDGQHRVAALAHLYGLDYKVKVMRFKFKNNNHLMRVNKNNFITVVLWFVKKVYRKLKNYK